MSTMPSIPATVGTSPTTYLQHLEALRQELQAAMLAIAGDRLSTFEESLWRQQVLCTSLKHLSHAFATDTLESSLSLRIRESTLALHEVSRAYSALVQQASASGDLLLRLCRSYKDAVPTPLPGVASSRLLSCEA